MKEATPKSGRPSLFGEKMVRKTITIPAEIWDKAAQKAMREGKSMSEIIRGFLNKYASK